MQEDPKQYENLLPQIPGASPVQKSEGGGGGHSKAAAMKSHLREVEIPFIDRLSLFSVGQNGAKTSSEVEAQQDLDKSCYCRVAE